MLKPVLAPVRPHVISPVTGDSVPLEDEVLGFLERGQSGVIVLLGDRGSGRTTALAHLLAVLPTEAPLSIVDDGDASMRPFVPEGGITICARRGPPTWHVLAQLRLQPWGRDEWIEYLLSAHHDACGSVLSRIDEGRFLEGSPRWWRIVLDRLAGDVSLANVRAAVEQHLQTILDTDNLRRQAGEFCLASMQHPGRMSGTLQQMQEAGLPREQEVVVFHRPIRILLAAEAVTRQLQSGRPPTVLHQRLPRELAESVGRSIADDEKLLMVLSRQLGRRRTNLSQAMTASLLRFANPQWRPEVLARGINLQGSYLDGVGWNGIHLRKATLVDADFSGADLVDANLEQTWVSRAVFHLCNLQRASLSRADGDDVDFTGADLTRAVLNGAELNGADFVDAMLSRARLVGASLVAADFTRAKLTVANLANADLHIARLQDADLTDAEFSGASLIDVDLRTAIVQRTSFRGARMNGANLEEVDWPGVTLAEAVLYGAHLTGSRLPQADLRRADLTNALLGEIDWEQADLRDVTLRGASFHMGSTREGLLSSPFASEGTRTGYYTDEATEQYFRPPEEIRKANLRGCDLRGADIEGVDFYLVDLREARLDSHQIAYLQSCGAILSRTD